MWRILCLIGIHHKNFEQEIIFEGENISGSKFREFCRRCNWKSKWEKSNFRAFQSVNYGTHGSAIGYATDLKTKEKPNFLSPK